jgi:hypothetical protein
MTEPEENARRRVNEVAALQVSVDVNTARNLVNLLSIAIEVLRDQDTLAQAKSCRQILRDQVKAVLRPQ